VENAIGIGDNKGLPKGSSILPENVVL